MISGRQRQTRKSTVVVPVENGDEQTADQFSKIFMWVDQQENVLETISDAFNGSLITGMNLLQVWVDYRNDPISGNIKVDNCPYNSFLIDPYFRKADMSDCNGLWKRVYLTKAECLSLLPDKADEIMGMTAHGSNKDGKFQHLPESYDTGGNNLLTYDEFYYRDYRSQKMLVDTQNGEVIEWKSKDDEALKKFLKIYPEITVINQEVPTVRLAIVVHGKVMYDGPNPMGIDTYPFVPVFSYYNPQMPYYPWRIQGVVRGLRDAQYLYNRRKVIELDILESQVNSGWKYKENALVNPKDVFQSGQGRGIALKANAMMTDVEQIMSPAIPPSTIELSKILGEELNQISGVNEELTGAATDDKAGILSMLRQGAGLVTLQVLFDQLDTSQKLLGKIILSTIQNNFTPGKIKRIIEQEPTAQFYNKNYGTYDAIVTEGLNTVSQKQMALAQLLHLKEIGIKVPDEAILENVTIQNKAQLKKTIEEQSKQAQQMEQQRAQIEMQEIQARINLANSRAEADRGLAVERDSRVKTNESMAVERVAEAQGNRMSGVLDMVKALKELEDIDLNQIQKLIAMSNMLKDQEAIAKVEVQQGAQSDKAQQAQQQPQQQPEVQPQMPAQQPEMPQQ